VDDVERFFKETVENRSAISFMYLGAKYILGHYLATSPNKPK
jgi:hypothetical protein